MSSSVLIAAAYSARRAGSSGFGNSVLWITTMSGSNELIWLCSRCIHPELPGQASMGVLGRVALDLQGQTTVRHGPGQRRMDPGGGTEQPEGHGIAQNQHAPDVAGTTDRGMHREAGSRGQHHSHHQRSTDDRSPPHP